MGKLGLIMNRATKGRSFRSRPSAIEPEVSMSGRRMRAMGAAHAMMLNPRAAKIAGLTL